MTDPVLIPDRLAQSRETLQRVDQAHVLRFFDDLPPAQQQHLLTQIEEVDWPEVARLVKTMVLGQSTYKLPEKIDPAPSYPSPRNLPEGDEKLQAKYADARALGEDLIRQGKVAAFTVAGGQGTRLGWDGPKGTFPATPIRKLPLFAVLAEYLLKVKAKYGRSCPWYIMTSPINDQPTQMFFEEHDYFGLDPADVMFFPQGMLPAFHKDGPHAGKAILDSHSNLALSPNGHGGSLKALYTSGAIQDMRSRGIEQISYTQIDNPLVKVVDPLFLGLHAVDGCGMSSKMLPKAFPKEKLGNFCLVDGRVTVIEYSDLPDELAEQRTDDGQLRFRAGSIAIHAIRVDFVESLNTSGSGFGLPYHRAEKKVPYLDLDSGQRVEPETPNAVKLETFVFDALPLCEHSIVYETDRVEEFAPIKNASGVDSAESSRDIQIERAARWLESHGLNVPRDGQGKVNTVIEVQPTTAVEFEDLGDVDLPRSLEPGRELLL